MSRILLNIGRGTHRLPGFIHLGKEPGTDLQWDSPAGLPFPAGSVGAITCANLIEQLPRAQTVALLRDCRRALARDGVLRVATVDLDHVLERAGQGWDPQAEPRETGMEWVRTRGEYLNAVMREPGRQWLYGQEELVALARAAGLELGARCSPGESRIPELRGLEHPDGSLVLEFSPRATPVRSASEAPLVSVLIPAYRPTYLYQCLDSALGQTYPNVEVVISDDCPTDAVREALAPYLGDPRIRYRRNPVRDGIANHLGALALASGEYIKFLNDDDVLAPRCVERMVEVLNTRPEVSLVTSHRQQIDAHGAHLPDIAATRRIVAVDSVLDGQNVAEVLLATKLNFIGEPSTPMFRRADVLHLRPHPFSMAGVEVRFECDVALWSSLLSQGDLVYLVESLSYFRRHGEQAQVQPENLQLARAEAPGMLRHAQRMGFFTRGVPRSLESHPIGVVPGSPAECDPAVFYPAAAPVELGDVRAVRLLCIPDWRDASWARALMPLLTAITSEEPVSVVVRVDPPMDGPVHAVVAALQEALAAANLGDRAPDIVIEASQMADAKRGGLYTAASALLLMPGAHAERYAREARACGVPCIAATTPEELAVEVASLLVFQPAATPASMPLLLG